MNINHEVKNDTLEETKLASVLSMVMDHLDMDPLEHMRKEIQSQCSLLNISAGKFLKNTQERDLSKFFHMRPRRDSNRRALGYQACAFTNS